MPETTSDPSQNVPKPSVCDCTTDPIAALQTMFVAMVMGRRMAGGQSPVQRPVFLKPHGVARGVFTIEPSLPPEMRVGVFRGEKYEAWVRFSSDTVPAAPDLGTTLGIGLKLFGVPGPKLLPPDTLATTQDFVLQNHDVFFVDTARDMCEFTHAGVVQGDYEPYLAAHPVTRRILSDMQKSVPSVLATSYWSVLPSRFGATRHAKFKLVPVGLDPAGPIPDNDPQFLRNDLVRRLRDTGACFHFLLQFYTDDATTPLDRATERWDETVSPPVHVATLAFPKQDISARGQADYGENLSFNPWHTLAEHEPVGSIAQARKAVYQASAQKRRDANAVPSGEPTTPRPILDLPVARDTKIVRAAIHPAIGIARVGNSTDEFFLGPEVTEPVPEKPGFYKDSTGALKRQAARFRIYGYNAAGQVVAELNANNALIAWTVHVANKKAAWYQFQIALDIPEAKSTTPAVDPSLRRNAGVKGADRQKLTIDPGPVTITGASKSGSGYAFDQGRFFDRPVYLGELQTDKLGRLVFLGGRGVSASASGAPAGTFANNDGWHDDTSDGPVTAVVSINGQPIPCQSAWVAVAPPNYAPSLVSVRTMYDLLRSTFVDNNWIEEPATVSFKSDVLPVLQRLARLQWVNAGFAASFGWGVNRVLDDPLFLRQLSKRGATPNDDNFSEVRRQIFNGFRIFDRDGLSPVPTPWIYGDAMDFKPVSPRQYVALSPLQMRQLKRWAAGDFIDDYDTAAPSPAIFDSIPVAGQPAMLDRASLTFCLADAFHPGCELTWPMRHISLFSSPFRVKAQPTGTPEPDYGPQLTPEIALQFGGPLSAQGPGDLTRWMAVPWQTDTASCQSGYDKTYDPFLPTFWPARVPNQVLTFDDYQEATDPKKSPEARLNAFRRRPSWMRVLAKSYKVYINQMIAHFGAMGVIEEHPQPPENTMLPSSVLVESKPGPIPQPSPVAVLAAVLPEGEGQPSVERELPHDKVHRFHA